jgi:hypothetical protein
MRIFPFSSVRAVLFVLVAMASAAASFGQVAISITIAPPPLPVYEQPLCPGEDYIWIPGYWAWDLDDEDYYWVPGTWVLPPEVDLLWTPPYWAWVDTGFVFYDGFWAPEVGFYGGVVYGFGYFGRGYEGGHWEHGHFYYNVVVNKVDVTIIHNVYKAPAATNITVNRVSYNGGEGGVNAHPTPEELAVAHERHLPPVPAQTQHVQAARTNPQLRASANLGKPPIAATPKPGAFRDRAAVPATAAGAPYHPADKGAATAPHTASGAARPGAIIHPNDLPALERPSPPNTGDPKLDQKYLQEQENLFARQEQERQALQRGQDLDHQHLGHLAANAARMQELEQRHQQQTMQLQQRHDMESQRLQTRLQAANPAQPRPPSRPR